MHRSGKFRFFRRKSGMLCVCDHQSLRLSQKNIFADRQYARIHREASDLLLVACGWRYCCHFWALHCLSGVPIGSLVVCSATVAFGCVCSSHVSGWLTSVVVCAAVPLGVSCFLSCWGREILCGPSERRGEGRLFPRGIRIQAAAA